jgi:hypothetical protein
MMGYRHLRRVSHEEDEGRKKEQLRILLQKFRMFVQELRGVSAFMEKLDERRAHFQMEVDRVKMFLELEDERQSQFENEVVSPRTIMVEQELRAQFRNEMASLRGMCNRCRASLCCYATYNIRALVYTNFVLGRCFFLLDAPAAVML